MAHTYILLASSADSDSSISLHPRPSSMYASIAPSLGARRLSTVPSQPCDICRSFPECGRPKRPSDTMVAQRSQPGWRPFGVEFDASSHADSNRPEIPKRQCHGVDAATVGRRLGIGRCLDDRPLANRLDGTVLVLGLQFALDERALAGPCDCEWPVFVDGQTR